MHTFKRMRHGGEVTVSVSIFVSACWREMITRNSWTSARKPELSRCERPRVTDYYPLAQRHSYETLL